jgi:manganese transport protein
MHRTKAPAAPLPADERNQSSIPEVFRTIPVRTSGSFAGRFMAFLGPGYLVATGYMDPGNWATALAGGSAFGYTLCRLRCFLSLQLPFAVVPLVMFTASRRVMGTLEAAAR